MPTLTAIQPIASESQTSKSGFTKFRTTSITGALGAEILDLDLSRQIDDLTKSEIESALMQHQVIVFRNQNLNPYNLVTLARHFGKLHMNPFVKGIAEQPEVIAIKSEENHEKQFTGLWHSDISWSQNPSMGSLLYAVQVPECGGDTLFTNMYQAFSSLSPGMKKLLESLNAEHRVDRYHKSKAEHADGPTDGVIHPVVRTHPVTGKKILFVNEYFTTRFESMSEEESSPLLDYLFQHSVRPDFTCRIQWEPGTLVFWDNRCTLHYATNDYPNQSRLMHRQG